MVEIFKTNVCDPMDAVILIDAIRKAFPGHKINFDLQDCDHILRIETCADTIQFRYSVDQTIRLYC